MEKTGSGLPDQWSKKEPLKRENMKEEEERQDNKKNTNRNDFSGVKNPHQGYHYKLVVLQHRTASGYFITCTYFKATALLLYDMSIHSLSSVSTLSVSTPGT